MSFEYLQQGKDSQALYSFMGNQVIIHQNPHDIELVVPIPQCNQMTINDVIKYRFYFNSMALFLIIET